MKRIYIVKEKRTGWQHFVEAGTRAEALRIVANDAYSASVASAKEVAEAASAGKFALIGASHEPTAND